jgi:hypothetical protein
MWITESMWSIESDRSFQKTSVSCASKPQKFTFCAFSATRQMPGQGADSGEPRVSGTAPPGRRPFLDPDHQILLASLSLLLTVVLGGFLFTLISNQSLDRQYQLRALGIATTTAQVQEIRSALAAGDPDPKHIVDGLAQEITAAAQSAYVGLPTATASGSPTRTRR